MSATAVILSFLALAGLLVAAPEVADVCVYGGTSGAVAAAVQTVRMGKTVILVSPDRHLGGLSSGGLGFTDIGDDRILGGLSREFFNATYEHYSKKGAWEWQPRETYRNVGQHGAAMNDKSRTMSVFEPKVAAAIFDGWVKSHSIRVIRARLDRGKSGVTMDGRRITAIRTEDGGEIRAKMFIDATYEGDLMALAGVSFTTGREANSKHGEKLNGIQTVLGKKNQLPNGIDPYVKPGDPTSGLLPGVNQDAGGSDGAGDALIQAYCYRMCLTNHPPNRVAVDKPDGYDEAAYEILFRAVAGGQTGRFFKTELMPNFKTDSNNDSGISTDFIGGSQGYPGASYQDREKIAKAHENWQRGLIWTIQNHPRIPEAIRSRWAQWGLAKDEFADTGHWPHALYVREARRMVGDHVVSEELILDSSSVKRSVGMGAYSMDSHNVQRHVGKDGFVRNEGDVQVHVPQPYRIDFGALLPKQAECGNLLVTFCVSATHIAFGSIRMEPVFMTLSQSAATAAVLAIDGGTTLQDLPYEVLRKRLLADGQKLSLD